MGLFLLALASIQATRHYEHALGEPNLALPGHWWATVGAVVAVLLVMALVLSWLFVPQTLGRLAAAVAAVLALVGQIVAWAIMVISYPIFMVLAWLVGLLALLPLPESMQVAMAPLSPLAPPPGCRPRGRASRSHDLVDQRRRAGDCRHRRPVCPGGAPLPGDHRGRRGGNA